MYKEQTKKKFLELAEFFADMYEWECVGENKQVCMYEKKSSVGLCRLNVYPNGTIHPVLAGKSQKSFKKCSDKVVENLFCAPFKNPYEQKSVKVNEGKKLIPIQELINDLRKAHERMDALEREISDLRQAFIDKNIIFGGEEPVF